MATRTEFILNIIGLADFIVGLLFVLSIVGDMKHVTTFQIVGLFICTVIMFAIFFWWRIQDVQVERTE